jgi:hypothetical protein
LDFLERLTRSLLIARLIEIHNDWTKRDILLAGHANASCLPPPFCQHAPMSTLEKLARYRKAVEKWRRIVRFGLTKGTISLTHDPTPQEFYLTRPEEIEMARRIREQVEK